MKTQEYSSLGLKVNVLVPESVTEFDTNAKREGACLAEAINNCVYRGTLAEFRDEFCIALEASTGVERKTKPSGKNDASGNPVLIYAESEGEYPKRVAAEKGVEITYFQSIADEVAGKLVFDASARERKAPAPKKIPQWATDTAKQFLSGAKSLEKFSAAFAKVVGTELVITGDDDASKEKSLAAQCVAFKAASDVFGKM